jgi:hypothetical protein
MYSSSMSSVHLRILDYSDKARTIPTTTLRSGYYRLHSFWHYCSLVQNVNFKSGTSTGGKHTTSCIHDVLVADHKTNTGYQRLGVASKGTTFIPHSSKSVLQLPSSSTQQNTVTVYVMCIPFMHTVQITNKYHI